MEKLIKPLKSKSTPLYPLPSSSSRSPPFTTSSPRPHSNPLFRPPSRTYRLSQFAPLLHLVRAVVQRWGKIVMPQCQMPELGFHRPIPRRRGEGKEGENREDKERGEMNGGGDLSNSAVEAKPNRALSLLLPSLFLTCWSLLTEPSRPALEARHSLAPQIPPCPWGSSFECLRRCTECKKVDQQLLFQ